MSRTIALTRALVAVVDDADYPALSRHKWFALANGGSSRSPRYVAARSITDNGKRRTLLMHRVIASASEGQEVDHCNRNPLDNRRSNLRIASRNQNVWNKLAAPNRNGFRGVRQHRQQFRAEICVYGRTYRSRCFATPGEAAQAYDHLAQRHHGPFAVLNFPPPPQEAAA